MNDAVPMRGVKICGITHRGDAEHAAACGATYLGVVLAPGGPRTVTADRAAILLRGLPTKRAGVFVDAAPALLRRDAAAAGLDVVQLHGDESPQQAAALREEGSWGVWKAIRPRNPSEFLTLLRLYAGSVDALLLDGWSAHARGGTGNRVPWAALASHRAQIPEAVPLVLAGGLTALNVAEAIAHLRPELLDVSSGVEHAPGRKEPERVRGFIAAVRAVP